MSASTSPAGRDPTDIADEIARFASVSSHDLRNGLATIRGYLDLIAEDEPLTETGSQLLARTIEVTVRMNALVDAIGAYGRARRRPLEHTTVDTGRAVRLAWRPVEELADRVGAQLEIVGDLPAVHGDERCVIDVLTHVLDNAVRYHAPGVAPVVRVAAEQRGSSVIVRIDDDGPGLPSGTEDEVFEPFAKTINSRGQQRPGLGLAISRVLVERLGGSITAARRDDVRGTRITIELPAA